MWVGLGEGAGAGERADEGVRLRLRLRVRLRVRTGDRYRDVGDDGDGRQESMGEVVTDERVSG
jgi:hypothetical protein